MFDLSPHNSEHEREEIVQSFICSARTKEAKRKFEFWVNRLKDHILKIGKQKKNKLYPAGQLGFGNPITLLRTIWMLTSMLFGHRGRQQSRYMMWRDFTLPCNDGQGQLKFCERLMNTRNGSEAGRCQKLLPNAFSNPEHPDRCPVAAYKDYAKRRPEKMFKPDRPFYLAQSTTRNHNTTSYSTSVVHFNIRRNYKKTG